MTRILLRRTAAPMALLALVLLFALPLVLPLGGCGAADRSEGVGTDEDRDLQLPRATYLGDEPPSPGRVDVTITGAGALRVNGKSCDLKTLLVALFAAAGYAAPTAPLEGERIEEDPEDVEEEIEEVHEQEIVAEEPVIKDEEIANGEITPEDVDDGQPIDFRASDLERQNPKKTVVELPPREPSPREQGAFNRLGRRPVDVLLRVDRRVPWRVVADVMMTCADPKLELYRLFAAVRDPAGHDGAIAVFLPLDGGGCGGRMVLGSDVRVRLEAPEGKAASPEIVASLRRFRARLDEPLFISLKAAPLVTWGAVVEFMGSALAADAYSLTFEGLPRQKKERSIADWIALAAVAPAPVARVRGTLPESSVDAPVADPGRRSGYFGFGNVVTMGELVVRDEDLDDAPDDAPADAKDAPSSAVEGLSDK